MRKSLLDLIKENNIEEIRDNIENYDVNYIFYQNTPNETTALIHAVYYERKEIVELLLKNKANVNIVNYDNETALIYSNDIYISELLINNNANVNIQDNTGKTSLIHNIIKNNIDIIELLLESGANVNIQDNEGRTALIYAVTYNNYYITDLLLKYRANPNIIDNNGENVLLINTDYDIAELLLENGADPNITDLDGSTPIMYLDDVNIIRLLLEYGSDVNHRNNNRQTPIMFSNDVNVIKFLIDNNANINVQDSFGNTPLSIAVQNGNTEIIKLLEVQPAITDISPIQSGYGKKSNRKSKRKNNNNYKKSKKKNQIKNNFKILIDIGCFNAKTNSITYKLLNRKKDKWFGYMVEPNPYMKDDIKKNLSGLDYKYFNLAISNKNAILPFYLGKYGFFNRREKVQKNKCMRSSLVQNKDYVKRHLTDNKIDVKSVTLQKFINDNKINKIDLLKIDTEGHDYDILKEYFKNKPNILPLKIITEDIVENKEKDYDDQLKIKYKKKKLLEKYGYKFKQLDFYNSEYNLIKNI